MNTEIKDLYVIGNGFDLHHNIPSSYGDFKTWLASNHININGFEEVFGYDDASWWSNFENNMGEVNTFEYAMNIASENPPDLLSDHCDSTWNDAQIYVEDGLKEVFESIKVNFSKWIRQLCHANRSRMIRISANDSFFLTFNYTKTLEDVYQIPRDQVLHIHGSIEDNEYVIGHGKTREALEKEHQDDCSNIPAEHGYYDDDDYDPTESDYLEIHEQWAYDAALEGVAAYRKNVEQIIHSHKGFFMSLSTVSKIHIYGFSFSNIDIPYIEKIINSVKLESVQWEISDYNNENRGVIETFFKRHNITNYIIISLDNMIVKKRYTKVSVPNV